MNINLIVKVWNEPLYPEEEENRNLPVYEPPPIVGKDFFFIFF